MSENMTSTSGKTRTRKGKPAPEIELPASEVREIETTVPASEAAPVETPAETPTPEEASLAPSAPEEMPVEPAADPQAEAPLPPLDTPAPAAPSKLMPAAIGLVAGLIGGLGGGALAPQLVALTGAKPDPTVVERLSRTEELLGSFKTREEALKGEIASLNARIASEADGARKALATLESKAADLAKPNPDIDALKGRLAKVEGESQIASKEVSALGTRVGTLQPKLDTQEKALESLSNRVVAVGAKDALALANGRTTAQALLEDAFGAGKPYAEPLDLIARTGGDATLIALVKPFADKGAPGAAALREEFKALKPKPAESAAQDAGFLARARKAALSLVEIRQVGNATAKGDEGAMTRIDQALAKGDLRSAMEASAEFSAALAPTFAPWRARLEARIRAGEAVVQLRKDAQSALARAAASAK